MNYFGTLTNRMSEFRERLLHAEPVVCVERALITTEAYKSHGHQPLAIRRALMLKEILEKMSIYIEPQTLLAGNQASANRAAPIFPEYAMDWVIEELDDFEKRDGDRFYISGANKRALRGIASFWENNTVKDRGLAAMPAASKLLYDLGIIRAEGNITSGDAHIAVMYSRLLEDGVAGVKAHAERRLSELDLTEYTNLNKLYFLQAVCIVAGAVEAFAERYADLACEMAKTESKVHRKNELAEMARILRKVPRGPADTFHEALQSVWLVHLILQIESNGHSLSYGRMDQFLYPYYKRDIAAGTIDDDLACELLTNLWMKTYSLNKIRSWGHTKFSAGSPLYQNVTIGGQLYDAGAACCTAVDAVNPLSYLILKSVAQTRLPQPNLTVRYHSGMDDRFMKECVEVMRLGFGMPSFNNDEVIIPSFIEKGVSPADAYNYSAIGCVEVAVPGKWGYRCTGMSFLNFPRTLMIALNDGVDVGSGVRVCEGAGHFRDFVDFSRVMAAWEKVAREFARHCVIIDSCADMVLERETADILCSALCDDCIERGLNLKEGGAVYDFISDLQVGIANLADSLAAIKKCVYDDKNVTAAELWGALLANFEGDGNERIRQILLSAPKFGNDDDYADILFRQAYDIYIDEMKKYHNTRYGRGPIGGAYYAGTSSITANVPQGAGTSATPDGRKAGEPLAEGCSPGHSMDRRGPTAVFKSVSKLPIREITGGVLLNQKVAPGTLEREGDRSKFVSMLRAFFDHLSGFHVQFNVVSHQTLLDAQAHPEKHRDLIVRVAGYSAFFNALSKTTQDDIIGRTEQTWR
jgi:formate C-acetyltransferase